MLLFKSLKSINNYMEKIKQFIESELGKDILVVFIVILVGLGSFELGRLSKTSNSSGLKIEYLGESQNQGEIQAGNVIQAFNNNSENNFFASSKGSKYYSLGCSGGKTIKQENRIYFATGEEAEQAGYALSTSCN
jgi:hypothetical protein